MTERSIFLAALDLADPAARAAYLDRACGPDADLRRRVEALLAAHAASGTFMDRPAAEPPADATAGFSAADGARAGPAGAEAAGWVVAGRYKLLKRIGEGGMGAVWTADQTEPVRRRVAVKLIRTERGNSPAVLARFEAERQAIALMDHPHIAKLLDAGTTEAGNPFFVMELVDGAPLTEFCDAHRLTVRDRLSLFRQVCSAVQHAHQKGVIHRDLKPGNVLVEGRDGKPVPKVIDFGLAKATAGLKLTEQTLHTGFGSILGTPMYMAPEQAAFDAADVDTRADVYALGVILYELLTGTTPVTRETIRKAQLDEMLRLIREQEAPTPSSRLGSDEAGPAVAANRQTEPAQLGRLVRGELDWIVLKALNKERDRRYESAAAFGADVDRFLRHEPVTAGPLTAGYRVRKFVRRNRGAVTAAGLVLLALVGGTVGTTVGMVRAAVQRDRAVAAEKLATERLTEVSREKQRADEERRVAVREAANATAIQGFLQNDLLLQSSPTFQTGSGQPDRDVKVRTLLDRAAARLPGPLADRPRLEGAIRSVVGQAYLSLGEWAAARAHLGRAIELLTGSVGGGHPDAIRAGGHLASVDVEVGQFAPAEQRLTALLAAARRSPDTPPDLTADLHLKLAYLANLRQRPAEAKPHLDEAEPLAAGLADTHPVAIEFGRQRGAYLLLSRQYPDAERQVADTLARVRRANGNDHPLTLDLLSLLGIVLNRQGKHRQAAEQAIELVDASARVNGPEHPSTLNYQFNLARALQDGGRLGEAEDTFRRLVGVYERLREPDHIDVLGTQTYLADVLVARGKHAEAEGLYARLGGAFRTKFGAGSRQEATVVLGRATCLLELGRYAEAEPPLRECAAAYEKLDRGGPRGLHVRSLLGAALLGQRKYADAEPLLTAGYDGLLAKAGNDSPRTRAELAAAADRLIGLYQAWGKPDQVVRWQTERRKYPFVAPHPRPAR